MLDSRKNSRHVFQLEFVPALSQGRKPNDYDILVRKPISSQAKPLTHEALDPVPLNGVFENSFGNGNSQAPFALFRVKHTKIGSLNPFRVLKLKIARL